MNKTIVLILLAVIAVASIIGLSAVRADTPSDYPEFYFTRLIYREGRRPTMPRPAQFRCPEFGGGRFFPQQGWGWATDYPGGDCKFMGAVHRLTGIRVHPDPNVVGIMDAKLFEYPFVYAVEVGEMSLNDAEAARLREYLLRGGFLHVDDFWGLREKANFVQQMARVFPDRQLQLLDPNHPVFSTFFDVDKVIQIPNRGNGCSGDYTWESADDKDPAVYGISDDSGRLMVVATYNSDLGDAWEYMDLACYPALYSGAAYRMGLNFMIYAMTH